MIFCILAFVAQVFAAAAVTEDGTGYDTCT